MTKNLLFDTISIQHYVFGSNKLRDNLGASYIIKHIYDDFEKPDRSGEFLVGYIGGGNALIFTSSYEKATSIIEEFTTKIIYTYPGVSIGVAIKENFGPVDIEYKLKIKELFAQLAANKGKHLPVNTIPSHGITDICRYSSLSVEKVVAYVEPGRETFDFISSLTASKRIVDKDARKEEESLLTGACISGYNFPLELDKLGQYPGEDSHIAIVHIDGNGFGEEFRNINDSKQTELLSRKVRDAVQVSFVDSIVNYINLPDQFKDTVAKNYNEDGQELLPIRPIILGGDDVTFICNGKWGIWFAERFMEKFKTFTIDEEGAKPFSACAGVAVVKTKYPFYRAYILAEELCDNAKDARKKLLADQDIKDGGNWIDFHLAYGGLGNTLKEMRNLQYMTIDNEYIFYRPFSLEGIGDSISLESVKNDAELLKKVLPNSKIKDLREVLTHDAASQKVFIEHLIHQHVNFKQKFCQNYTSTDVFAYYPFFDMIELLEVYPTNLLNYNQYATTEL